MRWLGLAAVAAVLLGGCGGKTTARIRVMSPAFPSGGPIPVRFTCQGQDVSPPLRWSGIPSSATTISLVMRDPDAPGGNFIHWQLTGIPPTTQTLATGQIPAAAKPGGNSFGTTAYRGPCPPTGRTHHYLITVTAKAGGAILGEGTLTGTYARR